MQEKIIEALDYIRSKTGFEPEYGIILGTGLGALVKDIAAEAVLPYGEIPHFPLSTVESHQGKLIFGTLEGKKVVVMAGRFHYYEGYDMKKITFPVRVMKKLGIRRLFVSNVSGGLNPNMELGDLMVIEDHINLHYDNPLRGKNLDDYGPRFPDMSEPYDLKMVDQALEIGRSCGFRISKGVYVSVPGPNLETRAEYRFLSIIGADAVGMSTIPEIIVARHMGIPCFAISVITDLCAEGKLKKITVEEILKIAAEAEPKMTRVIRELVKL